MNRSLAIGRCSRCITALVILLLAGLALPSAPAEAAAREGRCMSVASALLAHPDRAVRLVAQLRGKKFQGQRSQEFSTLEERARRIARLLRSPTPETRQAAKAMYRDLFQDMKRLVGKYNLKTKMIKKPNLQASRKLGHYERDPGEECIPFFESAKTVCFLERGLTTDTECWYECYDKNDEPVGVK